MSKIFSVFNPGYMSTPEDYGAQVNQIIRRAREWKKANPDRAVLVQWNFPKNVVVAATIDDAIKHHFISVDVGGALMLKAICDPTQHTCLMVRVALEQAFKGGES